MDIAVIGLGKLGAPLAAVLASRGHRVIGVDLNPAAVQALNEGRAPVQEPGLDERLARAQGTQVWVLHMLGNHGPSYYARYPDAFKRFTPVCEVDELGDCERDTIVNAYDNAILYTDTVVADAVAWLERQSASRDTALLYVSDHGESLGESGLYLHGVPRMIAPEEQLKVPMWLWLSPELRDADGIDMACLRKDAAAPRTHDVLFSTVLGLMRVETMARDPALDLLDRCRFGARSVEPARRPQIVSDSE